MKHDVEMKDVQGRSCSSCCGCGCCCCCCGVFVCIVCCFFLVVFASVVI